jgi:hypothetical protein
MNGMPDKVSGQMLRDAFEAMQMPDDLRKEANQVLRKIRRLRERVESEFGEVRNAAIAHQDDDSLVQYRAIQEFDMDKVLAIIKRHPELTP